MQKSEWHRDIPGAGRQYTLPRYVYSKYDDAENIVARLTEQVREFVIIDPAVRFITDSKYADSERLIIKIPYEAHYEAISTKIAELIYQSLIGYYFSANPKTNHFGVSNYILEGNFSNLLIRELERMFYQIQTREDMAGRIARDTEIVAESETAAGENFLKETVVQGLDITLGFRLVLFGRQANSSIAFVPFDTGFSVIDQIYYNLEQILMQNFSTYDELNDTNGIKLSNTLIFKELVSVLRRAKNKEMTRKKLLNDLKFPTSLTEDMSQLYGKLIGDPVYDTLNHVNDDRVRAARDRSRDLYNAFMIKSAEITNSAVDVSKLKIGEAAHYPVKQTIKPQETTKERPTSTTGSGAKSKPKGSPKKPSDDSGFRDI